MKQYIRIFALLAALLLALSVFGCQSETVASSSAEPAPEETSAPVVKGDRSAIAVKLDNIEITAGQLEDNYNSYMQMLSYYGMSAPTDEASIHEYVQMIAEDLIVQQLPLWKAQQLGMELTEEEKKEIDVEAHTQADAEYKDLVLSYASYFTDAGDISDVAALTEKQLADTLEALNADIREYYGNETADIDVYVSDMYDMYTKELTVNLYADKLRAESDGTISVDDETVEAWYNDAFAQQKESFDSDPTMYRSQRDSLEADSTTDPLLYVPEGLALIELITLTPEGTIPDGYYENQQKLLNLEAEYGKIALAGGDEARLEQIKTEYAALAAENEVIGAEYFAAEKLAAEAAYERLSSGEEFDKVATDATGAAPIVHLIWYAGDDYNFSTTVREAVSSMEEGTFSNVLFDGDSYYIVYLVGHLNAGAVDRASIAEAISAAAARETRDAAWEELTAAWEKEALAAAVFNKEAYAWVGH